jgi:hypothetical protein
MSPVKKADVVFFASLAVVSRSSGDRDFGFGQVGVDDGEPGAPMPSQLGDEAAEVVASAGEHGIDRVAL